VLVLCLSIAALFVKAGCGVRTSWFGLEDARRCVAWRP